MTVVAPTGYVVTKRDIIHRRDCTTNPINASPWIIVLRGDRACSRCLPQGLPTLAAIREELTTTNEETSA